MSQPPYQGWSAPVPPPPKKRRVWPWVVLGVVLLLAGGCAALIVGVVNEVDKETKREITVTYEVTGDAKDVTVTYSTYNEEGLSQNQVTGVDPPWRKEEKTTGFVKGGTLVVSTGASGGTVRCKVTADGTTRTATASGTFATATCDGF
ncbi:hypothetical protein ABT039_02435 [Streptomyces lasiicapitis]|uniref:hypothetical protein n=1 Tax=Streptomyces lasiicapitis TaxID=1923961 RepID=UPI003320E958